MKCKRYGKSDDCTVKCPPNADSHCDISGGHEMIPNPLLDALNEIKKYCAVDSNNGYARTFYHGMQLSKYQIGLILKRYGL